LKKEISDLKQQYKKSKEMEAKYSGEARKERAELKRLKEDVVMAQAEANQANRRAEEAKARAAKVRQETLAKKRQYQSQKARAVANANAANSKEADARITAAGYKEKQAEYGNTSGKNNVAVNLKSQVAKLQVKKTCNIRRAPSSTGKVLTRAKAGQKIYVQSYNSSWHKLRTKNKAKAYISKGCF
jgi:chromosome segregation ATPase